MFHVEHMSHTSPWRRRAYSVIREVLAEVGRDPKALRLALRTAYPFGERRYWPYKVWLSEVNRQCGYMNRRVSRNLELF